MISFVTALMSGRPKLHPVLRAYLFRSLVVRTVKLLRPGVADVLNLTRCDYRRAPQALPSFPRLPLELDEHILTI